MTESDLTIPRTRADLRAKNDPLTQIWSVVYRHRFVLGGAALMGMALVAFGEVPFGLAVAGFLTMVALAWFQDRGRGRDVTTSINSTAPSRYTDLSFFSIIVDALPEAAVLLDADGMVVGANDGVERIVGIAVRGHHLSSIVRTPAVLQAVEQCVRTGEAVSVSYFDKIPVNRWYQAHLAPLDLRPTRPAAPLYVLLLLRDLTKQQQMEKIRADFVANASHELRTPLSSLVGFIETLQGNARNDPVAQERFLDIMLAQANRMSRLINDLMSLSRIEANAHIYPDARVDLRAVIGHVRDSLAIVAKNVDVAIRLDLPADLDLTVVGDNDELVQVFQNLVENAIRYGQTGKEVVVRATKVVRTLDGTARPDRIRVAIRDFGPGISPEHQSRLTERFYRVDVATSREKGGTGLGLAIVKHILNRHRAVLSVQSEPGVGSEFAVTIDAAPPTS